MVTGRLLGAATTLDDPVYMAIAGRHCPASHCPVSPALQQGTAPLHALPLGVQVATPGAAQVPPALLPEQHFVGLAEGWPSTRQLTLVGGVAEAHAVNIVPSAQPEPS